MGDLQTLEAEVRAASDANRTPYTGDRLAKVELEIDLLRKQCKKPRHYVASSVEGSPDASPTRRRRLVLKVTNSVTTIIKGELGVRRLINLNSVFSVVEEALARQAAKERKHQVSEDILTPLPQQDQLNALHRKLSELQSSTAEDEAGVVSEARIQPLKTIPPEQRDEQVESLLEAAAQVRAAIDNLIAEKELTPEGYDELLHSSMVSHFLQKFMTTRLSESVFLGKGDDN
jgi:hypothetical protein